MEARRSKAELIDQVFTDARGNLSARDAVEHEESPNSCEDDTSSEFSDSDDSSCEGGGGGGLKLIFA